MSPDLKQRLTDFYNARIVAGWYASWAMWLGLLGTMLPILLDGAQMALDHWPELAQMLELSPRNTLVLQLVIAALIPPARAWQQRSMQVAALKQAAQTGNVTTRVGLDAVIVAVPGTFPQMVRPEENG
ncbi:hypothetical protein NF681_11495 [Comamonadaceae bacterium OTU4NAUVB1]|nr:hypothetical protein NF681_11495 [Comamonadaceae bacterium OTU4NAUVB1]